MLKDIVSAVENLVTANFTKEKIYVGNIKKNFERPSFLISYKDSKIQNVSRWIYREVLNIQIAYFSALDKDGCPEAMEQFSVYDKLNKIFSKGFIEVNDRKIKILEIKGKAKENNIEEFIEEVNDESKYNEMLINLTFDITESIEETFDDFEKAKNLNLDLQEV